MTKIVVYCNCGTNPQSFILGDKNISYTCRKCARTIEIYNLGKIAYGDKIEKDDMQDIS